MPQQSTIKKLPTPIIERLNFLIAENQLTLDDLTAWLDDQGHDVSRSAVGRHSKKYRGVAQKLQQSRDITSALVRELGEAAGQGEQGRLLVEMARSLVFDLLVKIQNEEMAGLSPKDVAMLGKGLAELGRALRLDQDFETKVREQAEKEARVKAAASTEQTLTKAGIKESTRKMIEKEILGLDRP